MVGAMHSSSFPEYKVTVFGSTNVGSVRSHNEDNFLVSNLTTGECSLQPEVRNHIVGERGSLFMVADGMGGGAAGEVASQIAITAVFERLLGQLKTITGLDKSAFAYWLKEAVEHTNGVIYRESRNNPEYKGMGTTTSAAGFFDGTLFVAQVGDSRAYLVRRGLIKQITKDQSLVNKLLDAGLITEEEAENHENKNVILQALGVSETVDVVLSCINARQDDILVLCSDGLSGLVKAEEIRQVVETTEDQANDCRRLIDMANERGGYDNITVIIARFSGNSLPPATDQDIIEYTLFEDQKTSTTKIQGSPTTPVEKKKPIETATHRVPKGAIAGIVLLIIAAILLILWGLRITSPEDSARINVPVSAAKQPALQPVQAPPVSPSGNSSAQLGGQASVSMPALSSASTVTIPSPTPSTAVSMGVSTTLAAAAELKKSVPPAGTVDIKTAHTVPAVKVRTFEETAPSPAGRNVQAAARPETSSEPNPAPPVDSPPAKNEPPRPKTEGAPVAAEPAQKPETTDAILASVAITIQSNPPGISFFIDGEEVILSTPAEIKLKPGRHILKFKFGPLVIERPIEVRSASDKPFVFDFETIIQKPTKPPGTAG
jgi:serine/threonine protein phosphatase PrpC